MQEVCHVTFQKGFCNLEQELVIYLLDVQHGKQHKTKNFRQIRMEE